MTFTQTQIDQALAALPKENHPVMAAIVGQLQSEIRRIGDLKTFLQSELANVEDDLNAANGRVRQLEQASSLVHDTGPAA